MPTRHDTFFCVAKFLIFCGGFTSNRLKSVQISTEIGIKILLDKPFFDYGSIFFEVKKPIMTKPDLSTESLLARKAIAEKATPGDWKVYDVAGQVYGIKSQDSADICIANLGSHGDEEDFAGILAAHIAANSPDVAIATVDELLRLRAELEQYKDSIQSLRYVADKTLADCNFRIKENISLKEELLRLREENARMEKEAVWLASGVAVGGKK